MTTLLRSRVLFAALVLAPLLRAETAAPTPAEAFTVTNEKTGFALPAQLKARDFMASARDYMARPPELVKAHPDAARFPGAVPADAPRISRTENFTTGSARWQSTGLYAAPGEIVTVTLDTPLPEGVTVRIHVGCHTDHLNLNGKTPLKRFPVISREFTLKPGANKIANAFGGGLFVEVRGTAATEPPPYMWQGDKKSDAPEVPAKPFTLAFAGAVEAPLFQLGKNTAADWEKIRNAPAPWGELVSDHVILHVPTALLRELKEPEPLLKWWDRVIATEDELAGWKSRPWRERVVPDIQISAGWMHAGYPFMYHLVSAKNSVDLDKLTKDGDWGFFHEMGHNHQTKDWTFDGQTEVTVNLFSLYCMETIVGKPRGQGHDSMRNLGKLLDARFAATPSKGAFEQLAPFVALIRRYYWAPVKATLGSYQTKPNPAGLTEAQRQAEFVARYSEFAKADLSDFFAKLGYDITGVAARVKDFPKFDYTAFRASLDKPAEASR